MNQNQTRVIRIPSNRRKRSLVISMTILGIMMFTVWTTVFAQSPSLAITKTSSTAIVDSGEVFQFVINYRCASITDDCLNATIEDVLDPNLEFISILPSPVIDVGLSTFPPSGTTGTVEIVLDNFDDGVNKGLTAGSTGILVMNVRFRAGHNSRRSSSE